MADVFAASRFVLPEQRELYLQKKDEPWKELRLCIGQDVCQDARIELQKRYDPGEKKVSI